VTWSRMELGRVHAYACCSNGLDIKKYLPSKLASDAGAPAGFQTHRTYGGPLLPPGRTLTSPSTRWGPRGYTTAMHLAATEHADYRAMLWHRLERIYEPKSIFRNKPVRGSSDEWKFDAVVSIGSAVALFELVSPHVNAVSSAVTKFLDIRDLGEAAPSRIAVLTKRKETPHLSVLARTARVIGVDDPDDVYRRAA
jgi:hypothetical protein